MIKAKPHQQQPPKPAGCIYCDEKFNNIKRAYRHADHVHKKELESDPVFDLVTLNKRRQAMYSRAL